MHLASKSHTAMSRREIFSAVYFVFALLGVLPLVVLTPPFQVPDEPQHFYRAFQISELSLKGSIENGKGGAMLPSSLPELTERFLGTRALHTEERIVSSSPLGETLKGLSVPLESERREFVDFSGAAFYSPLPYLPQVLGIALGRQFGLGPLGLLYAGRLVNALVAIAIVVWALCIIPVGGMPVLALALLPMTIFEFASVSPDAAVIACAVLFTAVATRARFAGPWTRRDLGSACAAGAVFCSMKPVYAPLLMMSVAAAFEPGRRRDVVTAHAVIIAVVVTITAVWLAYASSVLIQPVAETDIAAQAARILGNPMGYIDVALRTVASSALFWYISGVGVLGWLNVYLPIMMYVIPFLVLLSAWALVSPPGAPRINWKEALLHLALVLASAGLSITALYLYFTPVGATSVQGVQGRYFIPIAPLFVVSMSAITPPSRWCGILPAIGILSLIAGEVALTSAVIIQAYHVL
jgi:uncharacterized membrane protein